MVLKGSWLWNCSRIELVNTSLCSHLCFWTTGARSSCPWFDPQLLTVNILSKELDVVIFCYCCIERIITLCHSFVTSWFWKEAGCEIVQGSSLWNASLCSHFCFWTTGAKPRCPWLDPQLLTVNILSLHMTICLQGIWSSGYWVRLNMWNFNWVGLSCPWLDRVSATSDIKLIMIFKTLSMTLSIFSVMFKYSFWCGLCFLCLPWLLQPQLLPLDRQWFPHISAKCVLSYVDSVPRHEKRGWKLRWIPCS